VTKRRPNVEFRHEVSVRLREAIRDNGLTISVAAKMLRVTRQTLWLYLNERSTPGGEVLKRACKLWKLTLNVEGFSFTSDAFGPEKKTQPRAQQLDLFRALEKLRPDQIDTRVIGCVRGFFELRVRIKIAS
jgi:transcriptional regulator with XRE-family HTH domain